jgi:hypothetical protein
MKSMRFTGDNRSDNLLHIELPGCIVNIRVNLTGPEGRAVTSVLISPDDNTRSPDLDGYFWRLAEDGCRVIRDPRPGMVPVKPSVTSHECLFCGVDIEQDEFGRWYDTETDGLPDHVVPGMASAEAAMCTNLYGTIQETHVPGGGYLMHAARCWIADCFDDVEVAELSDREVYDGVQRHYEGGWTAFANAEDA